MLFKILIFAISISSFLKPSKMFTNQIYSDSLDWYKQIQLVA